jgi:hypothetical protein
MLLRRVIEHVEAQNWTAILIDFVIVVVGVFIGIQVSNWNDDRQSASRTQNYYNRLIDDLESERRSKFLIDVYQASQIWTYSVQRATYDEILASGIADAIPDSELRTQLANVFLNAEAMRQVVVATTPYRQQIRLYLPNNSLLILELPENCGIEFREEQIATAINALDEYPQFERELVQRLASIDVNRTAIEAHLLLIDSLIKELRTRLR